MPMDIQSERLPYDHLKFVNRADEVRLVVDKVQRLAAGLHEERRVVIFHGARGSGKSWLLREIKHSLQTTSLPVLCACANLSDEYDGPVDEAVRAILQQIYHALAEPASPSLLDNIKTEQWTELLAQEAKKPGRTLVVMFDHVDESSSDLLALLEDRCLSPLAVLPNALIVLAGRGKEYVWKRPELRLKSEERDLTYFDLPCTREQIEKQVPQPTPSADEIQALSGGYPWSNYILGIHHANKSAALDQCVVVLLHDLPVAAADLDHLRALCVLHAFSDMMIPYMFSAYFSQPDYKNWGYRQCRQVRQALIQTTLVKWNEPNGGYVIDEALRRVLEHQLHERGRTAWERMHTAARDLFAQWQEEYPRTAGRWQAEVAYHDGKLTHGPYWMPESQEEKPW
jgi:hypothetical protein